MTGQLVKFGLPSSPLARTVPSGSHQGAVMVVLVFQLFGLFLPAKIIMGAFQ